MSHSITTPSDVPHAENDAARGLRIVDRLLSTYNPSEDVCRLLAASLSILAEELPDVLGGAYLVVGDAQPHQSTTVARQVCGSSGLAGPPLADLLRGRASAPDGAALPDELELVAPNSEAAWCEALEAAGCPAVLLVPLRSVDRVVGCLALAHSRQVDRETLAADLYAAVGRAIGLGIDNAWLYQNVSNRLRRSQALYKVSRALAATLDLDHVLSMIVTFAVDTIERASNGVLHLLDEQTGELRPRALSFQPGVLPADASGCHRMRLGHGVAGLALEEGRLVNVPDVASDARFIWSPGSRRFAAMAVAPLMLGDRRIGTLSIDSTEANAFDEEDEQLLATLATMAAVAIDNARLVADLQQSLNHLRTTQEQLIQSAKLSAVGQLISGVAHELNNPLTAIMGYAQLLQMAEGLDDGTYRDLDKVYVQARRAADIVQNLLTFARQRKQEASLVDVNEVLRRTLELREYQLRRADVRVRTRLASEGVGVMAAPDHLQQVLLQLLNNAQDAVRDVASKEIVITTEHSGEKVRISVADNGHGLTDEDKAHLFEPFYTTKEVGQGTGLGLSICFGIVHQYGGTIRAEGAPGQGATFIVEFPAPEEGLVGGADEEPPQASVGALVGPRRLLVASPRQDTAGLLEVMLQQQGHRVHVVEDGETALARADEAKGAGQGYDALLVDVRLTDMESAALLARLRRIDADLARRVVFIVTGALDVATARFLKERDLPYVERPFDTEDLQQVLESAAPRRPA